MKNRKQKAVIIVYMLPNGFLNPQSEIRIPHSLDCVDNLFGAGSGRADFTDDDASGVIC